MKKKHNYKYYSNLIDQIEKIRKNLSIPSDLKNTVEGVKIEPFKMLLVRLDRLELSLGYPTWPSTKLVYQFQHSRFMRQNK